MKKMNKVLLCVILSVMTIFSFSACNESKEEKAVRKTVEGYASALKEADFGKAQTFVDEDCELYEEMKASKDGSMYMEWGEMMVQGAYMDDDYATDVAGLFENLFVEISKKQEIKVDKVTVSEDGKTAEVKCKGKAVDEEVLGDAISMEVFEEIEKEMYGTKSPDDEELYRVFEEQYKRALENVKLKDVEKTVKLELKGEEWKIVEITE